MIPQTIGREFDIGKVAPVQCVKNDPLTDLEIKGHCFLLLMIHEGSAYFQAGDMAFEAIGPCFVCFDERKQPKLIKKRGLRCDAIYFHPTFLNINMTFERVHGGNYKQLALTHDLFLLKPFTDEKRYVFPLFEEYTDSINGLFAGLEKELSEQRDWYWSCRSRSFFMEIILMLEKAYGIIGQNGFSIPENIIQNPHLKNAVIYIESHYHKAITLKDITKAASLSHSSLTQLFKKELDTTPVEYLWQYRIRVAKKHLEFTSLPIKDISARCGFKTVQHFSRKFEAYTGYTPSKFRDMTVARRKAAFAGA